MCISMCRVGVVENSLQLFNIYSMYINTTSLTHITLTSPPSHLSHLSHPSPSIDSIEAEAALVAAARNKCSCIKGMRTGLMGAPVQYHFP